VERYHRHLTARERRPRFETTDEREERLRGADRDFALAAEELGRTILGPVAPHLAGKRLLVAADGALHHVKFEALPEPRRPGRPLIVDHEVAYLPSASILARQRREQAGRAAAPRTILVMADPVFGAEDERVRPLHAPAPPPRGRREPGGLPRLFHTRREADAVEALVPEAERRIVTGFDASHALAVGGELRRYRVLHFASHALVDDAEPDRSGIHLSRRDRHGRELNGLLRAAEIRRLELAAELVVLSTCSSGLGRRHWGEGLMSLSRAFFHAGAARVLVSLWNVDDRATGALMRRFYHELLGRRRGPAAALRAAQLALRESPRWRAPYYWAAFGLHGEYAPLPSTAEGSPVAEGGPGPEPAAGGVRP
jgi:CHAT domain-containing protein